MVDVYSEALKKLGRPLLQAGVYRSEGDFLRDLVKDLVEREIGRYQNRIRHYEKLHHSLEQFNAEILNTATPKQEDEVWDWEEATDSLEFWQETAAGLGISNR
jgi:hypothetical protein